MSDKEFEETLQMIDTFNRSKIIDILILILADCSHSFSRGVSDIDRYNMLRRRIHLFLMRLRKDETKQFNDLELKLLFERVNKNVSRET